MGQRRRRRGQYLKFGGHGRWGGDIISLNLLARCTSSITVLSVNKARVKNSRFFSLSCLSQPSCPWPVLAALKGKSGLRYVHVFRFNTVMLDVTRT